MNEALTVVPFGPTTSSGNVIPVEAVEAAGFNVIVAVAEPPVPVAVAVTVDWVVILLGAVYNPALLMLPVDGLMVHVGLVIPEAVNCCVPDGLRVAWLGLTLTAGAVDALRVMVAVAVCVGLAMFATVSMIVCNDVIVAGAVYTPFDIVPTEGARVQVTAVDDADVPAMETLNWVVWPPVKVIEEGVSAMPTVGTSVIVALPVLVESAKLVAVTVTVCWLLMVAGAW